MAKGSRGGKRGGSGTVKLSVIGQNGETINLADTPLKYGSRDPNISDGLRTALEKQENRRKSAKIEYGLVMDNNGNVIGSEVRGGKSGVRIPEIDLNSPNSVFTHNHPRGKGNEGLIGGTFSNADLDTFATTGAKTFRASAAEGTYSITKKNGFNAKGFNDYQVGLHKAAYTRLSATKREIERSYRNGKVTATAARQQYRSAFNGFMVELHNGLIDGQKKYGYYYTLEG